MARRAEHEEEKPHGKSHGASHSGPPHGGGHEEAHEGAPEWLISFADNVTLMMGFFVLLLAMNLKPQSGEAQAKGPETPPVYSPEALDAAIAIRSAFNNPVDLNSANPIDLPLIRRLIEREGESRAERRGQIGREHDVRSIRKSSYFGLAGSVSFGKGMTTPDDAGQEEAEQLARAIRGYRFVIVVRGHVSADEAFDSKDHGIQLAFERAVEVARRLANKGVPWRQMRLESCADGERLAPRAYDDAGHQTNRRVEVIVTDRVWDDGAPAGEAPQSIAP